MQNSDLFGTFLDECRLELSKPANSVIWENIKSTWENLITTYEHKRVSIVLADQSLSDQLQRIVNPENAKELYSAEASTITRGFDVLYLHIEFDFPYTLLFRNECIGKYELLFRFLLRLTVLNLELSSMNDTTALGFKSFCLLRRQMLHLIQNIRQYLINEVIEAGWTPFMEAIRGFDDGLQELMQLHTNFIDSCLRQSMLANAKLIRILNLLFLQCNRLIALHHEITTRKTEQRELDAKLVATGNAFCKTMRTLLEALQYYSSRDYDYHLGTLFSRLDFNSHYYSSSFAAI